MIKKSFRAPNGSGIRHLLVAPEALSAVKGTQRSITVIVPSMTFADVNWRKSLPDATYITVHSWLRRANDFDTDLIIVEELPAPQRALITATLARINAEVWTVNHDTHDAPLHPHQIESIKEALAEQGITTQAEAYKAVTGQELLGSPLRINVGLFTSGINVPDVEGFVVGDRGVIPFAADVSGSGRNWELRPRTPAQQKRLKRTRALSMSDITRITADDLDHLLAPYMSVGILRTTYERCTGAIEYRGPSGRVFAVSIGDNHFARRESYPAASLAMFAQQVGRITRTHPLVQS